VRRSCLALGVLRSAACFAEADFLALNLACITRYETGFAQSGPH